MKKLSKADKEFLIAYEEGIRKGLSIAWYLIRESATTTEDLGKLKMVVEIKKLKELILKNKRK